MSKKIVKACIRYCNRLYTGFEHGECFKKLDEDNTIVLHSDVEQGFIDNKGNFVDRKQAMIIAKESGQVSPNIDKKTLISEDLHLSWLNEQAQQIEELKSDLQKSLSIIKQGRETIEYGTKTIEELNRIKMEFTIDRLKDIREKTRMCLLNINDNKSFDMVKKTVFDYIEKQIKTIKETSK